MSIEAMKQALEALEGINDEDRDKDFLNLKQFVRLDMAIEALRTALQQAEAQQPATGEPDDVVRDVERYRWLRDHDHWPAPFSSSQEPEPVRGRDLDAAIDDAMLTDKEGTNGEVN